MEQLHLPEQLTPLQRLAIRDFILDALDQRYAGMDPGFVSLLKSYWETMAAPLFACGYLYLHDEQGVPTVKLLNQSLSRSFIADLDWWKDACLYGRRPFLTKGFIAQ